MKKLIRFLLGDAFLRSLVLQFANRLFDLIIDWQIKKIEEKYRMRPVFHELADTLSDLNVEDFLKDKKEDLDKII